jgi:hypothetical protein
MERLHAIIDELARSPEKRLAVAQRAFEFVHEKHGLAHGARLADILLNAALAAKPSGGTSTR